MKDFAESKGPCVAELASIFFFSLAQSFLHTDNRKFPGNVSIISAYTSLLICNGLIEKKNS